MFLCDNPLWYSLVQGFCVGWRGRTQQIQAIAICRGCRRRQWGHLVVQLVARGLVNVRPRKSGQSRGCIRSNATRAASGLTWWVGGVPEGVCGSLIGTCEACVMTNIHSVYRIFQDRFRPKRMRQFMEICDVRNSDHILDIGGRVSAKLVLRFSTTGNHDRQYQGGR